MPARAKRALDATRNASKGQVSAKNAVSTLGVRPIIARKLCICGQPCGEVDKGQVSWRGPMSFFDAMMLILSHILKKHYRHLIFTTSSYFMLLSNVSRHVSREMLYTVAVVTKKRSTGDTGEEIACQFLVRKGYAVVSRNYLKPWGEIDIVAEKNDIVHFVEVKTLSRENSDEVSREMDHQPEDLVDVRKLRKVARTAALYMETTHDGREYQIDVVAVIMSHKTRTARCRLIEQALEDNL